MEDPLLFQQGLPPDQSLLPHEEAVFVVMWVKRGAALDVKRREKGAERLRR